MPLTGAQYRQRSKNSILSFLESELRAEFGEDIDLTDSSAFRTFADALSTLDAEDVEPALQQVHDAGFLQSADGENLENLVAILGIDRRGTVHATGIVRFDHEATASQNYTIQNGTVVQTAGSEAIEFETTDLVELSFFDDFENGSLRNTYSGQTGSATVVDGSNASDPSATEGSFELRLDANSGDKVFITANKTSVGSVMDFRTYLQDTDNTQNSVAGNLFGVIDTDNHYRIRLDSSGEHAIEVETTGGGTTSLTDNTFNVPENEWLRNEVHWLPRDGGTIVSKIINSSGSLVNELEVNDEDRIEEGGFGFEQLGGTENIYWDHSGERSVHANARSVEGGVIGNVGANSLTDMPSVPSGVNAVTNPHPMGDDSYYLTSVLPFDTGVPAETDEELRDRATVSEGARGNATVPALIAEATALPEAQSVSVYENKTNNDNTPGGLPPKAFELVYYGNDSKQDIADMLHATKAFTARDHGGAHGTAKSETVIAENGQTFTYDWTEPTKVDIDMTLDIVVNDSYIGDDPLRDRIVDYVGGTKADGTTILGTGTDEDVYVDQIEDVVTGPDDTGVIGIGSYSFTPSITTNTNNLEIVDIGANEVGQTDASDGSITLNVTRV